MLDEASNNFLAAVVREDKETEKAGRLGLALVDAGHFATEILMVEGVAGRVTQELGEKGYDAEVVAFKEEREPFVYA